MAAHGTHQTGLAFRSGGVKGLAGFSGFRRFVRGIAFPSLIRRTEGLEMPKRRLTSRWDSPPASRPRAACSTWVGSFLAIKRYFHVRFDKFRR